MNTLVEQLRYSHGNKHLVGKMLSRAVTIASSIGEMAEQGKQFAIQSNARNKFIGSVQLGEYILTGQIPDKELCESLVTLQ